MPTVNDARTGWIVALVDQLRMLERLCKNGRSYAAVQVGGSAGGSVQ